MLTLEERGAYTTLLDLMYDDGEPLLDNERLRAGQLGVPLQRYKKLRNILIDKKKIYMNEDGKISNNRFDEEMKKKSGLAAKRSIAGSTPKKVSKKDSKNLPKSDQLSENFSLSLSEVFEKKPNEINGKSNQMIDQNDNTNQIPDTRDQNKKKIYTKDFEDWLDTFPNRKGKWDASLSYTKALKETPHEDLIYASKKYADEIKESGQWAKNPSTWLNKKTYLDYQPEDQNRKTWETKLEYYEKGTWPEDWGSHPGINGWSIADHGEVPSDLKERFIQIHREHSAGGTI